MRSGLFIILITFFCLASPARAGDWSFNASGSAQALYGYSDVKSRYKNFNDNNHTPSAVNVSLSAEYDAGRGYRAGLYLDLSAGADKELEDYNQGKWGEEAYGIFDTPYGRVMLGQTYNAAYQFGVGAPSVGPLGVNNSDIVDFISNPNWKRNDKTASFRTLNSTDINTDGVAPKITYITPEFYHTMLGFTYVPDSYSRAGLINKHADYGRDDGYIAAAYTSVEIAGADVETSFGYAQFMDDDREFSAGIRLSRGGWSLGGSFRRTYIDGGDYPQNVRTDPSRQPEFFDGYREGYAWNAWIGYEIGPYQDGLTYFAAKADNTDSEDRIIQFSNQYRMNRYLDVYLIAAHVDFRGAGREARDNNKGYAFIAGVGLNF